MLFPRFHAGRNEFELVELMHTTICGGCICCYNILHKISTLLSYSLAMLLLSAAEV